MKNIARTLLVVVALLLFILGLETVKRGAGGVAPLLQGLSVEGVANTVGLGWIMAYGVLSGSPVAAVALALFGAQQMSDVEVLGMIAGSRFGGAFVVLLLGAIYYFRGRRDMTTVGTGILCLLVTWSVLVPAMIISYIVLWTGLVEGARLPVPAALTGLLDRAYGPVLALMSAHLHRSVLFLTGIVTLVGSFGLFDRALPEINPHHSRFRQIAFIIYRSEIMFLLGMAATCLTLSVSVSLGLLVPLSTKGYVRRENIIPYVMGANVSTFIDTLLASLLVGEPRAFSVVLALMLGVALFSFVILLGFYRHYRDGVEWSLEWITRTRRSFLAFLGAIMLVPVLLMLI